MIAFQKRGSNISAEQSRAENITHSHKCTRFHIAIILNTTPTDIHPMIIFSGYIPPELPEYLIYLHY